MGVVFNVHTVIIEKETSREPALFYNNVTDVWTKDFQMGCGCITKKEALEILNKLDVSGACILEGTVS